MNTLTKQHRIAILLALFAAAVIGMAFVPPFPQDPHYHHFADMRPLWGIPNFGDVVSNAAFLVVGLLGLATILGTRRQAIFTEGPDAVPYIVFFLGVALVGVGSGYYHLEPTSASLVWDRLPMTIAFMGLFSAIVADRIDRNSMRWLLPILVLAGAASVFYWHWSETQGAGDLRWYAMVQFFPMLLLPFILILFPRAHYTRTGPLLAVFLTYGAALVLDRFDGPAHILLSHTASGHTLKHLVAAVAVYLALRMVKGRPERASR
ncbi:MAG: ceramidase domain-containing protein [Rhodospirillaceae bacterium]|nr:ceramidase domain-containing protein [Rhodospirillaceae bacterium]MDD9917711.1 ceramidase domain-containing protein [Rhodospirillaceae bacterium]MDD9924299.1 ceramidase domain-containing protein [Rhodospirillaceae bacterium]